MKALMSFHIIAFGFSFITSIYSCPIDGNRKQGNAAVSGLFVSEPSSVHTSGKGYYSQCLLQLVCFALIHQCSMYADLSCESYVSHDLTLYVTLSITKTN